MLFIQVYLSAGPPGLTCVIIKGLVLLGSLLAPPRTVKPKLPPSFSKSIPTHLVTTPGPPTTAEKFCIINKKLKTQTL